MTTNQELTTVTPQVDESTDAAAALPMDAIVQDRYGSAEVLEFARVARPTPKPGQVLVEVVAAGIDRGTCHLMTGTPYLIRIAGFGLTKPKNKIPGSDVAGRVVAVGADVTRFAPGDDVFGIASGSLAEFAVADEDNLVAKPSDVSFQQAAASAVSGVTALQALVDVGHAEPGQRVLIVGASGGVGSFAVQLAKSLGTVVTAVASTRNIDFVRSLGADHVVDYTARDFTEIDEPFDLVLDIGGRNSIRRLRSVLTSSGTLVIVGGEGGNRVTGGVGRQVRAMVLSRFLKQRLTTFISSANHSFIERLAAYIESGAVTPSVQATFRLAETPEAIERLEAGRATGKTVIVVGMNGDGRVE